MAGYPEVIHTDEKALAIPIFRNPTLQWLTVPSKLLVGERGFRNDPAQDGNTHTQPAIGLSDYLLFADHRDIGLGGELMGRQAVRR